MASVRVPTLRHMASCRAGAPRAAVWHQRRWEQVHDVRFLATTKHSRSVLEKYRDKLDRKARDESHPDIETLRRAYADKIERLRSEAAEITATGRSPTPPPPVSETETSFEAQSEAVRPPKQPNSGGGENTGVKPLSSILDLAKVRDLPTAELTAIWRLRHAAQPTSLCAVIPWATYGTMDAAARRYPQFVLPVPHPDQGAEMHFLQWTWDAATRSSTVLFTQLAEYKARGEFATPHTTVTHYTDLAGDKGVVLMQGSVADDRGVKAEEARWLVMCLQRFYGGWDGASATGAREDVVGKQRAEERRRLLEWFARGDERFSVDKLMEEAERMG